MKRNLAVMLSLALASMLVLSGCVTINEPPPSQTAPTPESPVLTPDYHTLSFTLEGDGEYSFPIYLRNNEILHLMWRVENSEYGVWFHILTPSGKPLGFYDNEGQYANNTLMEGFTRQMQAGVTQFSPSDYNWGEGYYRMDVASASSTPVTVQVEYWIETK